MNKLKVVLFTLIVVAIGAANLFLFTTQLTAQAVDGLDHALKGAASSFDSRTQLAARASAAVAEAAGRQASVADPLAKARPDAAALSAATEAVQQQAQAAGVEATQGLVVVASSKGLARYRAGEANVFEGDPASYPFLQDAMNGASKQGFARIGDALWRVAAAPAGQGAAILVGWPVDAGWAAAMKAALGADVSVVLDGRLAGSTLPSADQKALAPAARKVPPRPFDVGAADKLGKLPIPYLFASAPAWRAQGAALPGVDGASVVLAVNARDRIAPLATYQQFYLVALAAIVLVGLGFSMLMSAGEGGVAIPRELVAAADKIAKGDFAARAPSLAGQLGTLAQALNRAAEAASQPPAAEESQHSPAQGFALASTRPVFAAGPTEPGISDAPEPPPAPDDAFFAAPPPPAAPFEAEPPPPPHSADFGSLLDDDPNRRVRDPDRTRAVPFPPEPPPEAVPPPPPPPGPPPIAMAKSRAAPPPPPAPAADPFGGVGGGMEGMENFNPEATVVAAVPEALLRATSRAAPPKPPPAAGGEESHWQDVFQEFVKTRMQCGEPNDGLTYEKFKVKLQKNKDQLVQKYACKTVKFQVYVKDGRAALKATPVRA